jgi:hypothetical protein
MIKLILATLFSMLVTTSTFASCEDASLLQKSSDGAVLFLDNGSTWEVDSIDRIDSALWLVTDDVLACDDGYLIHKSDGEKVSATKLK